MRSPRIQSEKENRGPVLTILLTIFASSFVIALSGALMPGPLLTTTISESSQHGFITGPLMIAGHAILELALVIALLLGLAPFFQQPAVFVATALIGSVILFWMAFGMFRSLPHLSLAWEGGQKRWTNHPIISGIWMSVANPYWIIWWATIGLGYILYSRQFGFWGIVFFFAGHILADLVWYSLIAAAVAGGRHFITDRLYRSLIAVCAAFLVAFAGYFAYAGFEKLSAIISSQAVTQVF
jgi:threonine/homoserine/homoserine lactone efflux protein